MLKPAHLSETEKALIEKIKVFLNDSDFEAAALKIREAEKLIPDNEELLFEKGRFHLLKEEWTEAVLSFKKTLSKNKKHPYAELLLAQALSETGAIAEAVNIFQKLNSKNQHKTKAVEELNKIKKRASFATKDKREAEELIKANLASSETYISLGDIYFKLGQSDKAFRAYWKGIKQAKKEKKPSTANRALNIAEIREGKTQLESLPRWLEVCLSSKCNINCKMCLTKNREWKLPRERIEEIISMGPILENITWYGGEVLFLENFQLIYDQLQPNSQLRQHIVTNGLLIDKVWAKKFTIDETHITYSIDAVDPKLYESIRRGASFTDLLKSLDLMNSARTKYNDSDLLSLNFVLMKSNLDQLPLLPKFLKNYRFSHLNIVPVTTLKPGDPENIFESSDKNLINKTDRLLKNLFRECQDLGIGIHEWYFQAQGDTTKDKTPEEKKKPICFKPWTKLQICEGGDVIPEQFCIKPVGNVVNNTLLEIWNSSMIINYRENLLKEEAPEICNPTCFEQSENRYLNKY